MTKEVLELLRFNLWFFILSRENTKLVKIQRDSDNRVRVLGDKDRGTPGWPGWYVSDLANDDDDDVEALLHELVRRWYDERG